MNNIIVNDVSKITNIKFELMEYDNYFVKKYFAINEHSDIPLHKFWFIAEKCKIIEATKNNYVKNREITMVFANKSKYLTDKLDIENKIRTHFKKKLHTESDILTINKFLYDNSTVFFNSQDVEEKYELNVGNEFDLIVELSHFEICAKHINFVWKIVQMKKIKLIDLKVSLFSKISQLSFENTSQNSTVENKTRFVPTLTDLQLKQNLKENVETLQKNINQVATKPISIAFTPALLQGALSKLKKPKTTEETEFLKLLPIKNEQLINQISNLKHVITKETSIIDIFKKEHRERIQNNHVSIKNIDLKMEQIFEIVNNNILFGLQTLKKIENNINHHGRISNHS